MLLLGRIAIGQGSVLGPYSSVTPVTDTKSIAILVLAKTSKNPPKIALSEFFYLLFIYLFVLLFVIYLFIALQLGISRLVYQQLIENFTRPPAPL